MLYGFIKNRNIDLYFTPVRQCGRLRPVSQRSLKWDRALTYLFTDEPNCLFAEMAVSATWIIHGKFDMNSGCFLQNSDFYNFLSPRREYDPGKMLKHQQSINQPFNILFSFIFHLTKDIVVCSCNSFLVPLSLHFQLDAVRHGGKLEKSFLLLSFIKIWAKVDFHSCFHIARDSRSVWNNNHLRNT